MADRGGTQDTRHAEVAVEAPAAGARPVELLRALAVLAEPPAPEHAAVAEALELGEPSDTTAHARLFLFELHPYASVHLGAEGMLGGDARHRIAGFWRAVGRPPPAEPDHLSALLVLYASLLEEAEEAEGAQGGEGDDAPSSGGDGRDGPAALDPPRAALARRSAAALLHEHLEPWTFSFLVRVRELGTPFQVRWATLLDEVLRGEAAWAQPPASPPAYLAAMPPVPDPRREGADAFLGGLLAPARAGFILTRGDLALVARTLGVGVRVAERRRVLEDLVTQDAAGTFAALRAHALRAAAVHDGLASLLGPTGTFLAARARAAADLLEMLADDGGDEGRP